MNDKKQFWFGLGIVILLTSWVYWPALFNGFTSWDDNIHLLENENIRSLTWPAIQKIFTTDISLVYIPLTALTYALEYHGFGYQPLMYHFVNVLLHLGVVGLIYVLGFRMTKSVLAAGVGALLFGIHPMHVESVAWVTERKDVLYSFFYLLALLGYSEFLQTSRKRYYAAALICALLSVLAKAMALSLPLVLFLLDYWHHAKFTRRDFLSKIPFLAVIMPIAWITYSLNSRVVDFHFPESIWIWIWTFTFYLRQFAWPFQCLPLYELPQPVQWFHPEYLFSIVLAVGILVAVFRFRRNRWVLFSFFYYLFSIFFLLRFDSKVDLQIVADRFMYLPSLGICLALGVAIANIWDQLPLQNLKIKSVCVTAALGCLVLCSFLTLQQIKMWGDGLMFWNRVLAKYPHNAMAYNQRGLEYARLKNYQQAIADYSQAITYFPAYDFAYTNRGIAFKELQFFEEAVADHSQAVQINPDFSEAYLNRGNVYFTVGDFSRALWDYERAIQTRSVSARRHSTPYHAEVYARRGAAHFFAKDYTTALRDFNQALSLLPDHVVALDNRAIIFSLQHQPDLALKDYARSLAINPRNPSVYTNRALLYYQEKKNELALADLATALALAPGYPRAVQLKKEIEEHLIHP